MSKVCGATILNPILAHRTPYSTHVWLPTPVILLLRATQARGRGKIVEELEREKIFHREKYDSN